MGSRSAPLRRQGEAALYAQGRTEAVRDPWPRDPGANWKTAEAPSVSSLWSVTQRKPECADCFS